MNAGSALEVDSPERVWRDGEQGSPAVIAFTLTSIPYSNFTYTSTGSSSGTLTLLEWATVESSR